MRRLTATLVLALAAQGWADPLLDKARVYYAGLKSYQARLHCRIYKGLPQGNPTLDTVCRLSAQLPRHLRVEARVNREGKTSTELHLFDGNWQWVESGGTRVKLALARVTKAGKPFESGLYVTGSGLIDGTELVGTLLQVLDEGGLEKSADTLLVGKYNCQVYTVAGERYGGDNRVALYFDDQGILRGYQERDWDDDGKELTALVTVEDFQPGVRLPASTFVLANAGRFSDKTAEYLSGLQKEKRATDELDLERFARCLRVGDLRNTKRLVKKRPELLKVKFAPMATSPLHLAAGKPEMVQWLLDSGADPTVVDKQRQSPLHGAESLEEWKLYAARNLDFKALQARCEPLMLVAFRRQSPEMVRFLQAQGVTGPLQILAEPKANVLLFAADSGKPAVLVPLALELGAAPEASVVPVLLANPAPGSLEAMQALRARGLDLDGANQNSVSLLMELVQKEHLDKVELLLEMGANPNRLHGGASAMHDAALAGEPQLLRLLLAAQGDPNLAGELGWTPLHCAAYWNREAAVSQLLQAGADPKKVDDQGNTPLHVAASSGYTAIYQKLVAAGASPDQPNSQGQTPAQLLATRR